MEQNEKAAFRREGLSMNAQEQRVARFRTALTLFVAYIAFLLGGYAERFSWSDGRWIPTALDSVVLAALLFLVIRNFWKPTQGLLDT